MSNETTTYVGQGFWNEYDSSTILVKLSLNQLRKFAEDAKKIFEEYPAVHTIVYDAPDPVEIDTEVDFESYALIEYDGKFEYEEIYDHNPRYSTIRVSKHNYMTYRTHPKHWDGTISFVIGNLLNWSVVTRWVA